METTTNVGQGVLQQISVSERNINQNRLKKHTRQIAGK